MGRGRLGSWWLRLWSPQKIQPLASTQIATPWTFSSDILKCRRERSMSPLKSHDIDPHFDVLVNKHCLIVFLIQRQGYSWNAHMQYRRLLSPLKPTNIAVQDQISDAEIIPSEESPLLIEVAAKASNVVGIGVVVKGRRS